MRLAARLASVIRCAWIVTGVLALAAVASPARAQTTAPAVSGDKSGIGERYWVEFSATWWHPELDGNVTSDRLGLIGSRVDLASDLALDSSRFVDFRFVVRPAKKHRIKIQYTPIQFTGSSTLTRDITFAGIVYPVSLPVQSVLNWKVFRIGYEWDFFYTSRGFVGAIIEGGTTELTARIDSIIGGAEVSGQAPLFAVGLAGRFYPIRHLAINAEGTGLKLTDLKPDHVFKTMSFDVSATYNITNYVGVSGGWRRTHAALTLDGDSGELNFAGFWVGGVVRY